MGWGDRTGLYPAAQMAATRDAGLPRRSPGGPPLILAHRGAWQAAPQNSPAAVAAAIALGVDGVEIDVRRTADGRLVVVHDPRLGVHRLNRLTHEEIKARMAPGQAPLLADLLGLAAGRLLVDVELKEGGYVAEALDTVSSALPDGAYLITSFHSAVLGEVRQLAPEIRTGLLLGPARPRNLERSWARADADVLLPHHGLVRAGLIQWAAERNIPAWVWTVNDPGTVAKLASDPRIHALITDLPADALRITQAIFTGR